MNNSSIRAFARFRRWCAPAVVLPTVLLLTARCGGKEDENAPAPSPADQIAFQQGEELEYSVKFLSLRLGTIRVKTDAPSPHEGRTAWHAACYVDSRSGIPFVSLHVVYDSHIDQDAGYSHEFVGSDKTSDDKWVYTKYIFDHADGRITVQEGEGSRMWKSFDIHTKEKYCDGLALFFYARRNAMYKKRVSVPTIIKEDTARTVINFLGEREAQEIDAVPYKVDCNHFTGQADWTGVYGLTGNFEGWFSNDKASIPIKAKMKLMVGSAWVELVKWRRKDWSPPRVQ